MGRIYYDDNYGVWDGMNDPDVKEHYNRVQKTNVWKTCEICGRRVKIQPHYALCNSCADLVERGGW